jgi:tripartite-type tricarboxylate transporter receptor subunit TctC
MGRPILIAASLALALTAPAHAQKFPDKTIEIINSFSPGGTSDLNIRALEGTAERILGQPIIQTFKQGGGGIAGTTEVANARPDGYKLLVVTSGELTAGPNLTKTAYSIDSFAFIGRLSAKPYGFLVRSDSPWKDFKSFQQASIEQPGKLTIGTAPRGGVFLAVQHLIRHAGLKVTLVPYGGSGPYVTALLGGHVDAVLAPITSTEAHLKAGTLRMLAITGATRLKERPDIPTLAEFGIESPFSLWVGMVAPKNIPADRLAALRDGFAKMVKDPTYVQAADKLGIDRDYAPADTFETQVREEDKLFKALIRELGLSPK